MALARSSRDRAGRACGATSSRLRPTSRTAWSGSCSSACRIRRCGRRGTGSGRRSSTAGEAWPQRRITVGLSPASLPKRGSGFDLGIAVAILSRGRRGPARPGGLVFLGELGLDGRLRPVRGVLPAAAAAAAAGFRRVVVPPENAAEAALVPALRVLGAPSLARAARLAARRPAGAEPAGVPVSTGSRPGLAPRGWTRQSHGRGRPMPGRTWLTWSASRSPGGPRRSARPAGITCCLLGPPGVGQDHAGRAAARRSCRGSTAAAALEVTAIHSVAGTLPAGRPAADRAAVLRAAPHRDQGRDRRRRQRRHPARRGVAGASRLPVPGRGPGIRPGRARCAASAAGVRRGRHRAVRA